LFKIAEEVVKSKWNVNQETKNEMSKEFQALGTGEQIISGLQKCRELLESVSRQSHPISYIPKTIGRPLFTSMSFFAACILRQVASVNNPVPITDNYLSLIAIVPIVFVALNNFTLQTPLTGQEWFQHIASEMNPGFILSRLYSDLESLPSEIKGTISAALEEVNLIPGSAEAKLKIISYAVGERNYSKAVYAILGGGWSISSRSFSIALDFIISILKKIPAMIGVFEIGMMIYTFYCTGDVYSVLGYISTVLIRRGAVEAVLTILSSSKIGLISRTSGWFTFARCFLHFVSSLFITVPAEFFRHWGTKLIDSNAQTGFENLFGLSSLGDSTVKLTEAGLNIIKSAINSIGTILYSLFDMIPYSSTFIESLKEMWKYFVELFKASEAAEITAKDIFQKDIAVILQDSKIPVNKYGVVDMIAFGRENTNPVCTIINSTVESDVGVTYVVETPWSILNGTISNLKVVLSANDIPNPTDFDALAVLSVGQKEHVSNLASMLNESQPKFLAEVLEAMIKEGKSRMRNIAEKNTVTMIKEYCNPLSQQTPPAYTGGWNVFMSVSANVLRISDKYKKLREKVPELNVKIDKILGWTLSNVPLPTPKGQPWSWSNLNPVSMATNAWSKLTTEQQLLIALAPDDTKKAAANAVSGSFSFLGGVAATSLTYVSVNILWYRKYIYQSMLRLGGVTEGADVAVSIPTGPTFSQREFFYKRPKGSSSENNSSRFKLTKYESDEEEELVSVKESKEDIATEPASGFQSESTPTIEDFVVLLKFALEIELNINPDQVANLIICGTASAKYMSVLSSILDSAGEELNSTPAFRFMRAQTNPDLQFKPAVYREEDDGYDTKSVNDLTNGLDANQNLFDSSEFENKLLGNDAYDSAVRFFLSKAPNAVDVDETEMKSKFKLFIDAVLLDKLLSVELPYFQ